MKSKVLKNWNYEQVRKAIDHGGALVATTCCGYQMACKDGDGKDYYLETFVPLRACVAEQGAPEDAYNISSGLKGTNLKESFIRILAAKLRDDICSFNKLLELDKNRSGEVVQITFDEVVDLLILKKEENSKIDW